MKKVISFCIIIIIMLCCVGCGNKYQERIKIIKEETNVIVPDEGKLEFCSINNAFLHGRLASFQVFSFDSYQDEFIEKNGFVDSFKENEIDRFNEKITQCKKNIEIPDDYMPNFDESLLFLYVNDVYFIYNVDVNELVVFINSH